MFGYILPEKPELKIKEYELFRAFYCGVCKSIGKRYGHIPRLTLNYDTTFLALLLSSISSENFELKRERCITQPLKKNKVIRGSRTIDYAADMNILLAYYKLEDDWKDEKSKIFAVGMLFLKRSINKLYRKYRSKCDIIKSRLEELAQLESEKCNSIDKAAEPFGKLMEEITGNSLMFEDEKKEKILRWLGYNIGKWIYVLDAYDDIEKDIKNNTYNPFLYQYEYKGEIITDFKVRIKDDAEFTLIYTLGQIANAFRLLDVKNNQNLIENILYMGMLRKTEQILQIRSCRNLEKSI